MSKIIEPKLFSKDYKSVSIRLQITPQLYLKYRPDAV